MSTGRSDLPQQFPRELALLKLSDVAPDLPEGAREAYTAAFEARRSDPLAPGGVLLVGPGGPRPLMALMRLMVLRFRDLNFERFEAAGGDHRLLTAYIRGENLALPLPERANALFVERADLAPPGAATALAGFPGPLFATWEGPAPDWHNRCTVIQL